MKRFEKTLGREAELKVEEWHIGKAVYLEVSLSGADNNTPAATAEFRDAYAARLMARGIKPLADGMSTLTAACKK